VIDIADIVARVDALPALPDTAVRLMAVINDPRSSMGDIVEAVGYDQALTSQVLKLCNSAYFGRSRTIASLEEAMLALGTLRVLQLVVSAHTNSVLARAQPGYGLLPGLLWRHSMAVALAAVLFAERLRIAATSVAFTAGLLHDIGKTVLSEHVGDAFAAIISLVKAETVSFCEAEKRILGFSHAEVGALIAEQWKLPETIVRCIRYHHTPAALTPPDLLVDTVYLADSMCLMMGVGLGEDGLCYRVDHDVVQRHGLSEKDMEIIGARTLMELRRVERVLEVDAASTEAPRSDRPRPKPSCVPR